MSDNTWYDATKADLETSQATQIRNNLQFSLDANPAKEAGYRQLYNATGIPVDSIRDNEASVRTAATLREFDADGLVKATPHTAQLLMDPDNTKLLHDAIPNTQAVENVVGAVALPEPSFGQRIAKKMRTIFGIDERDKARATIELAAREQGVSVDEYLSGMPGRGIEPLEQFGSKLFHYGSFGIIPDVKGEATSTAGAVGGAAGALAGFIGGGPIKLADYVMGRAGIGALEHVAGESFAKALLKDVGTGAAKLGFASGAAATGEALDSPDLGAGAKKVADAALSGAATGAVFGAAGRVLPDSGVMSAVPRFLGVQAALDATAGKTPFQDLANWDQMTPAQKGDALFNYGLNAMFTMSGAGRVQGGWFHDSAKAEVSKEDMAKLQMVSQVSAASALRERDPAMFRQFVENISSDHSAPDLYIDASKLNDALAQSGITPQEISATMPDLAAQLPEATAANGMVRIPMADYATHLAGTDIDAQILPHVRTDPEGMTYHEGQVFYQTQVEQLKAEVANTVAGKISDGIWQASKQDVHDDVQRQLMETGRVREDVANAYAALHASFFESLAARYGIAPEDAYAKLGGAKIVAEDITGGRFSQEGGANRGAYSPETQTLALLRQADLSTFLHESGHFFFDTYGRAAALPDAPEGIKQDFQTLLKGYGVTDAETWGRMTLDQQRDAHEQFARGFEAYLMEGKAPSIEMAGLFARFRSWLMTVYKSLADLKVDLSADVRGVMDRMLASEETIKAAEAVRGFDPLFKSAEAAGMAPEQWAEYQMLGSDATRQAVQDLEGKSIRDMKWLANAKKGALREMQALADARRKDVQEQITKEVNELPAFQAADYMRANAGDVAHKAELADWKGKRERQVAAFAAEPGTRADRTAKIAAWEAENPKPVRPPNPREQWAAAQDAHRVELKAAVKADMWEKSAEAKAGQSGLQKGQFFARNNRLIEHEVERQLIEWAKDHPKPAEGASMPKEFVAEMFGFANVAEMTAAIKEAGSKKEMIEAMTDRTMLERHGELSTPDAIERAAEAAIHNEVRGRFVATELRALTKAAGPAALIARAAKAAAESSIAGKLIGALRPSMYTAAEAKAAKNAQRALASNDVQAAAVEKRAQLLNNQLAKAAQTAMQEIGKGLDYLKKFDRPSVREKIDVDYRDQIDALLDRFDLRKSITKGDLERRQSLAAWVEAQAAQGLEPNVPEKLLNELDQKHYMQMTVEEFRGMLDAVKSIEHLGRLKTKLRDLAEMREIRELADEAADTMAALKQTAPDSNRGLTRMEASWVKLKSWGRTAQAGLLKMEQMMDWLDGRNPNGVFNRVVFRRLADAGTRENDMRVKVKAEIDKLLKEHLVDVTKDGGKIYAAPGLIDGLTGKAQKFTKKEMLMLAGNMGNESNVAKLIAGEKWSEPAVWAFLDANMSKADWDFVAGMGRAIESLWPEQLAMSRRLGNTNPEKIAPRPFTTSHGDYDGWYWPMIYDPARAQDVAERGAKKADALFENSYTKANTDTGRMNTRNENYAKPLLLDLDALPRVIMDNIHDISFREAVIDADKFLSHPVVRDGIISALSQEHYDQLRPWLQSIANDGKTSDEGMRALKFFNSLAHGARTRATIVGLGYRVSTMLVHGASAGMESVAELGAGWFAKGLKEFSNPTQWSANRDFIFDRSGEMRNRMNEVDRDVREHLREIELRLMDPATGAYARATDALKAHAYQGIAMLDMASALPTWMGAYLKGMSAEKDGGLGLGEQDAIYFADKTVRNAHGGTGVKDQAAVQRGPEFFKLFSMFYTFWNHNVNRIMDTARMAQELPATFRSGDMTKFKGDLGSVIMRTLIYTFGVQIMHHMLNPPKDDAGEQSWFAWAAGEMAMAATAGIPIVRDLAAHYISGKDYSVTPAASMVDAVGRSGQDIYNATTGQPVNDKWLKHTVTTAGYVFGLPTGQAASASQFLWDVETGQQHPEDVADWWRGLVHGDMKKH